MGSSSIEDVLNQIIWMHSFSDIMDSVLAIGPLVVIGIVILGVIQCFLGYKLFRFEMALLGAVGLGAATYLGLRFLLHYTGSKLILWTVFAVFMGAGMLFTVSAILVFIFTVMGSTGILMIMNVSKNWGLIPQVIIIISIVTGLVAMVLYRHVLIISQSLLGAGIIGCIVSGLFDSPFLGTVIGIVFAVLGLVTQYWMYVVGRRKERKREEEAAEAEARKKTQKLAAKSKVIDNHIDGLDDGIKSGDTSVFPNVKSDATLQEKGIQNPQYVRARHASLDRKMAAEKQKATQNMVGQSLDGALKETESTQNLDTKPIETPRMGVGNAMAAAKVHAGAEQSGRSLVKDVKSAAKEEIKKEVDYLKPTVTPTGTISVGDLKSKMKRV